MSYTVPFNRPSLAGRELEYVARAVEMGHISGDGIFSKQCHALLERELGVRRALLTTSCTHALELAALLLNIGPGDEVIAPSFTFVSTVNAFVIRGAKPVFADIRPDTLNLDERTVEALITPRTKVIVVMHYGGVGCEMDVLTAVAARHGLPIVEDAAHALFGAYRGRWLGTFGIFGALSFHETKNFVCGEGGALLVREEQDIERAEILREKGTDRTRFFRGEVSRYVWRDIGSSYLPSDLLAAFLYAQLEARDRIQDARRRIWEGYYARLQPWAAEQGVRLPVVPAHCQQSYHMFYLLMPSPQQRDSLMAHLKRQGILSTSHYVPLHVSPMGQTWGYRRGQFPISERASECVLRLPFYTALMTSDQEAVVSAISAWQHEPVAV